MSLQFVYASLVEWTECLLLLENGIIEWADFPLGSKNSKRVIKLCLWPLFLVTAVIINTYRIQRNSKLSWNSTAVCYETGVAHHIRFSLAWWSPSINILETRQMADIFRTFPNGRGGCWGFSFFYGEDWPPDTESALYWCYHSHTLRCIPSIYINPWDLSNCTIGSYIEWYTRLWKLTN